MTFPDVDQYQELEQNDRYSCAMARIHFFRAPAALPRAGDVEEMARYWKQYYNTPLGAGRVSKFIEKWNQVMGDK